MKTKRKGTRNEHGTMQLLEAAGYSCTRAAGSLGLFDVVGIGSGDVVLVQVKTRDWPRLNRDRAIATVRLPRQLSPTDSPLTRPRAAAGREGSMTVTTVMDQTGQRFNAPRVKFVTEWLHGLTPEQVARDLTGRDVVTGEFRLAVSLRNRHNGMVRFEADLWKLPYDLHPDACSLLREHWQLENLTMPKRLLRKMEQHFGRTHFVFDAMRERACDWRDILQTLLGDAGSYVEIEPEFASVGNASALTSG